MKTPDMLTTKQQIHNALEQLLVLFVKNNEYGDVDGLLDDTPFMPLFISLKKSVYEKLLTLAMQNEEIEEEELAALQEKTNIIWKGNAFSFPPLSAFATKEHIFRFCNFDLERFHQYLSDIEDTLLCTSYSQAIELIYSRMSMEGGVGIADTIRQNKIEHEKKNQAENRNEFDNDVSTDGIDYAIHWEDDNNYWTIDIWSFVYGKAVYYFHNQELADKYGYMLEFPNGEKQLWQKGIAGYKDIEVKIPRLLEDISRAFYESKCTFEHGYTDYPEIEQAALARYIIDKDIAMVERSETGKTRTIAKEPVEGDVGHMSDRKVLATAAIYHDTQCTHDWVEPEHGKASKEYYHDDVSSPDPLVELLVEYHCLPDEEAYQYIRNNRVLSKNRSRATKLFNIFKDADGLERIRLDGSLRELDLNQLRTEEAKTLSLVARICLEQVKI